ncbi:SGNH/GDSL hydrolase family protein [Galbibacter mesophilus]|uniref:SGNH/GDSL hydrolase family protein n=1 Tax=Galbibacter mesophilus TaxID=379069 RepID=UPI00191FE1CF|nr:SGNH/GDSL hydrolase family protein [Galbibacter mesophilus]MCM5664064.1 SGNH/GDSL hydrolase family protein [Galbibacter mesophilus]
MKINIKKTMQMIMKKSFTILMVVMLFASLTTLKAQKANSKYLDSLKKELRVAWPKHRTINLVFHGHSVPTGSLTKGVTDRLNSYPYLTLKKVNDAYPYSVVNTITTSIGGEQSEQGAKRMQEDVFVHKPDVLFIDYALNDRSIGLDRAKVAWEKMIEEALAYGTKVILLTPTPDLREDISSETADLAKYSEQIRELSAKYKVGLVDSYALFKSLAKTEHLPGFMAQNNHVNQKGHQLVADAIFDAYFNY